MLKTEIVKAFAICIFFLISCPAFTESNIIESEESKIYRFGVVPQQSAKRLAQLWTPILQHINQQTGLTLQFHTAKNIPTFEERLTQGQYDFAYMNPYHYTVFSEKNAEESKRYIAFAKRVNQAIKGIIVARKDSGINNLQHLHEKTMAFPSPAAFAATLLPLAELSNNSIQSSPKYVSSHDSVYLSVSKGIFIAGGGVKRTFSNMPQNVREQLNIIWTSQGYTPHAFAARADIPISVKAAIQKAFINLHQTPEGKKLLHNLKIKNGIEPANDNDWDDVRSLRIDALSL